MADPRDFAGPTHPMQRYGRKMLVSVHFKKCLNMSSLFIVKPRGL